MRIAIVGFPYSGKSTLFMALSGVPRENLKLAEENLAAVRVPEPRLDFLEQMYKPKKRTETTIEFVDLPGSTDGESEHASLASHLPTLRQADGLLICLRAFASDAVPTHGGSVDAARDLRQMRDELLLADLLICDGRVEKLEKAITKPSKERDQQKHELALLKRCRDALENGTPLSDVIQAGEEEKMLRSFGFTTQKPIVVAVNVTESDLGKPPSVSDSHAAATIPICAELEAELMRMEPADRAEMLRGYGLERPARDAIVQACFASLGLIVFLTAGEEEVRSWAVPKGATAVEAAGKIHSDLARGFIRAETVAFTDLKHAGSMRDAKARNKVRQEPKTYVVLDGDIMTIKFNV